MLGWWTPGGHHQVHGVPSMPVGVPQQRVHVDQCSWCTPQAQFCTHVSTANGGEPPPGVLCPWSALGVYVLAPRAIDLRAQIDQIPPTPACAPVASSITAMGMLLQKAVCTQRGGLSQGYIAALLQPLGNAQRGVTAISSHRKSVEGRLTCHKLLVCQGEGSRHMPRVPTNDQEGSQRPGGLHRLVHHSLVLQVCQWARGAPVLGGRVALVSAHTSPAPPAQPSGNPSQNSHIPPHSSPPTRPPRGLRVCVPPFSTTGNPKIGPALPDSRPPTQNSPHHVPQQ